MAGVIGDQRRVPEHRLREVLANARRGRGASRQGIVALKREYTAYSQA